MAITDTDVQNLIVNKLTYAQWKAAKVAGTLSETEAYEITDLDSVMVRRLSSSAATGGASQGVYVDANGQVQTCDAVTSTYSSTGTAPINGTAVKSAIDAAIVSVYKPAGSVAFANLPSPVKALLGNVYDVTDAFTTDSKFVNSGQSYPAGTNVVVINTTGTTYKYDVLPGFIDLTPYQLAETAVTHTKNTAAGSATQPVYIASDGTATATTYALNKTVPADAVFTDTTYSDFVGAGASTAGSAGLVPAPAAGDNTKFLAGDGTWTTVDALPAQSGQSGKFLTTNGTAASWANVDALPSQTGQSGKYLTTNGTTASWGDAMETVEASLKTINNQSILGSGNIDIQSGGGVWGSITGTLSSQTDLQNALNAKVNKSGDTMTGQLRINRATGSNFVEMQSGMVQRGTKPTSITTLGFMQICDKNGQWLGKNQFQYTTTGEAKMELTARSVTNEALAKLSVGFDNNNNAFASAPATSTTRTNATDIVTRGFLSSSLSPYALSSSLSTVATSGSYNDLSDKPTIAGAVTDNISINRNSDDELQTIGVINQNNTTSAIKMWTGTLAEYNAIVTKDNNTLYWLTDGNKIYKGTTLIADNTVIDQTYDGTSTKAQSGIAVASAISGKANDADVVHKTGNETITGNKAFSGTTTVVTPAVSDNSTKPATTAWVNSRLNNTKGNVTISGATNLTSSILLGSRYTFGASGLLVLTIQVKGQTNPVVEVRMSDTNNASASSQIVTIFGENGGSAEYFQGPLTFPIKKGNSIYLNKTGTGSATVERAYLFAWNNS